MDSEKNWFFQNLNKVRKKNKNLHVTKFVPVLKSGPFRMNWNFFLESWEKTGQMYYFLINNIK